MRFVLTAVVMLLTVVSALGREWKDSNDEKPVALTLVRDGQAAGVIVTNGRPEEGQALAAAELQEHIRLMSGFVSATCRLSKVVRGRVVWHRSRNN